MKDISVNLPPAARIKTTYLQYSLAAYHKELKEFRVIFENIENNLLEAEEKFAKENSSRAKNPFQRINGPFSRQEIQEIEELKETAKRCARHFGILEGIGKKIESSISSQHEGREILKRFRTYGDNAEFQDLMAYWDSDAAAEVAGIAPRQENQKIRDVLTQAPTIQSEAYLKKVYKDREAFFTQFCSQNEDASASENLEVAHPPPSFSAPELPIFEDVRRLLDRITDKSFILAPTLKKIDVPVSAEKLQKWLKESLEELEKKESLPKNDIKRMSIETDIHHYLEKLSYAKEMRDGESDHYKFGIVEDAFKLLGNRLLVDAANGLPEEIALISHKYLEHSDIKQGSPLQPNVPLWEMGGFVQNAFRNKSSIQFDPQGSWGTGSVPKDKGPKQGLWAAEINGPGIPVKNPQDFSGGIGKTKRKLSLVPPPDDKDLAPNDKDPAPDDKDPEKSGGQGR